MNTDKELFLKYNCQGIHEDATRNMTEQQLKQYLHYKKHVTLLHKNKPQHPRLLVLLHGNYSCNLNCIYCENHRLRENYHSVIIPEYIADQVVLKLGPDIRELTWHGGEPTLLPDSLISHFEETKQKAGVNFLTTLQSNGTLLNEERLNFYNSLNIHVGTSFDGLFNTTNRGELSTNNFLKLIQAGLLQKYKMGFITVYINNTIDHMIDNYNYYKSLGIYNFQSCVVRENVVDNTNPYLVDPSHAAQKVVEYIDYWIHDTDSPIYDSYVTRQISRLLGETTICEDNNCVGGWLIIDPYGNIGLCGMEVKEHCVVNIQDINNLADLYSHPNYLKLINKQRDLILQCEDKHCQWTHVCNGGCMGNNYEIDPTFSTVNQRSCEYNHYLLNGIYELIKDIDYNDAQKYNPFFISLLKQYHYLSLTTIKRLESEFED